MWPLPMSPREEMRREVGFDSQVNEIVQEMLLMTRKEFPTRDNI